MVNLVYYGVEKSLPEFVKHSCPFTKGIYNFTNITAGYDRLPLSQLVPAGTYKAIVNVSSKGQLWGHGWGTAEVKTPQIGNRF